MKMCFSKLFVSHVLKIKISDLQKQPITGHLLRHFNLIIIEMCLGTQFRLHKLDQGKGHEPISKGFDCSRERTGLDVQW